MLNTEIPVDSTIIDPGSPRDYHNDEAPEQEKPAKKTETQELTEAITALQREVREQAEAAEFLANRQRNQRKADDEEPEVKPRKVVTPAIEDENPDKFLDDLSAQGKKALEARGFLTREQMGEELKRMRDELRQEITEQAADDKFDQQLASDFPELIADQKKLEAWSEGGGRGKRPEVSELYVATQRNFKEMCADAGIDGNDPAARGLVRAAARAASKEIGKGGKGKDVGADEAAERRERIDRQRGGRSFSTGGGADEAGDDTTLSREQQQVMKHLGVSEKEFRAQQTRMENGGARRGRN